MITSNKLLFVKILIKDLLNKGLTLSTCESCTSGEICSTLTNIEGSSKVVQGGYITYSNEQKIRVGVSKEIIDKYGVYSQECAISMAKTCKELSKTNIGIGVTGTLGNLDDSNKDSQIGVVHFAFVINDEIYKDTIHLEKHELNLQRDEQKLLIVVQVLISLYTKLTIINDKES